MLPDCQSLSGQIDAMTAFIIESNHPTWYISLLRPRNDRQEFSYDD
jgi:hypothetical protein